MQKEENSEKINHRKDARHNVRKHNLLRDMLQGQVQGHLATTHITVS